MRGQICHSSRSHMEADVDVDVDVDEYVDVVGKLARGANV